MIANSLSLTTTQVEPADSNDAIPRPSRRQRTRSSSAGNDSENGDSGAPSSLDAMVKKMVRLALASEYSRLPIRRTDISAKVLGEQGTRQFKIVFEQAQKELRSRFGMEMSELPAREKTTISQRRGKFEYPCTPCLYSLPRPSWRRAPDQRETRISCTERNIILTLVRSFKIAAQKTEKPSSGNKSWILVTTLPPAYQKPTILLPTKAPSASSESTYTGLYTFIIALILLNGGSLEEGKMDRYLTRMNAEQHTPIERTDRLLARMIKEGYLVRTREQDGGEERIEFLVGPRGKVEVGAKGVAGLVREVYGRGGLANTDGRIGDEDEEEGGGMTRMEEEQREIFEGRLRRSLGLRERPSQTQESGLNAQHGGEGAEEGDSTNARRSEGPRLSSRPAPATQRDSESSGEEDSATDSD